MADYENLDEAMDWDDEEVSDEGGFTLLPDGIYPFRVDKIERERFDGSEKMKSSPRAKITLSLLTNEGWVTTIDRLILNKKVAFRIARFFEGLGYVKNPETNMVPVRWNEAPGKQGYLKLKVREYKNKDGETRKTNEVESYLKPSEWPETVQPAAVVQPVVAAAPAPQQPVMPGMAQPVPVANAQPHQNWSM